MDSSNEESQLRSIDNHHRLFVQFINATNYKVEVFWINYEGQTVSYGILEPSQLLDINTFVTHPWIFVEQETKDRFMVGGKTVFWPQPQVVDFIEMMMPGRPRSRRRIQITITIPIYSLRDISLRVIKRLLCDDAHAFKLDIPLSLQQELASMLPRKSSESNP